MMLAHAAAGLAKGKELSLRPGEEQQATLLTKLLEGNASAEEIAVATRRTQADIDFAKKAVPKQRPSVHEVLSTWLVNDIRLRH
jgi:hypothetical protein